MPKNNSSAYRWNILRKSGWEVWRQCRLLSHRYYLQTNSSQNLYECVLNVEKFNVKIFMFSFISWINFQNVLQSIPRDRYKRCNMSTLLRIASHQVRTSVWIAKQQQTMLFWFGCLLLFLFFLSSIACVCVCAPHSRKTYISRRKLTWCQPNHIENWVLIE